MNVEVKERLHDQGYDRLRLEVDPAEVAAAVEKLVGQMSQFGWLTMPYRKAYEASVAQSIESFQADRPVTLYVPGTEADPPEPIDGINPPSKGWSYVPGGPPHNWLLTAAATCLFWHMHLEAIRQHPEHKDTYEP